jgi:cytochrome c2
MRTPFRVMQLLVGWIAVAPPSAVRAQQPSLAEGAQVYAKTCGRCHNPRAPNERSDREWDVIVAHMRTRGGLPGGEARAVLYFLQTVNGVEAPLAGGPAGAPAAAPQVRGLPVVAAVFGPIAAPAGALRRPAAQDTGEAAVGARLFVSKGCTACHRAGPNRTGTLGPALDDVASRRTAAYLERKLREPGFDNPASAMPDLGLTATERKALIAYLQSLARR